MKMDVKLVNLETGETIMEAESMLYGVDLNTKEDDLKMDKIYLITYLDMEHKITHFDNKGFESFRQASEYLLSEGHSAHILHDLHTENDKEFSDLIFEYIEDDGYLIINWMAKISEIELFKPE